jgi:short-subunit dehydrogenase
MTKTLWGIIMFQMKQTTGNVMIKNHFQDKIILISGASSGIGRALSFELAARGANLILIARQMSLLNDLARSLQKRFPQDSFPLVKSCDITNSHEVKKLFASIPVIDMVINNAGAGVYGPAQNTTRADFRNMFKINFFGTLNVMETALPQMRSRSAGVIVNIVSVAAKYGVPYLGAYGASKAALATLSQSLRAELSGSGIKIMQIYPGYVQTPFFAHEKKVGGARRPDGPFISADKVARKIISAIQQDKNEVILSPEGKILNFVQKYLPWLVDPSMQIIANRLKEA